MNDNLILAAAIGAAVFLVVKKQGQAVAAQPTQGNPMGRPLTLAEKQAMGLVSGPQTATSNMNGDYWARLLGTGFAAAGGSGIIKNIFGQTSTSDGKPISANDPLAAFNNALNGQPVVDYVSDLFPVTSEVMEWGQYTGGEGSDYGSAFLGLF